MKFSIITVTYNSSKTIRDTINSILSQDLKDFEYIIIDGGSTDGTLEIIKSYEEKIDHIVSEPDEGIYDAYNKGLEISSGEVIAILNSDDIFFNPFVLGKVWRRFEDTGSEIVHGDLEIVKEEDLTKVVRYWKSSDYRHGSFQSGWHPPHPSVFIKKDVYLKYGLFDKNLPVSADFEIMLRFFEVNRASSSYLSDTLVKMRAGGHSKNLKNIIIGNKSIYRAFKKNKIKINPFLYFIRRLFPKILQFLKF